MSAARLEGVSKRYFDGDERRIVARLEGVSKRYFDGDERRIVVRGVDLEVRAGEWLVIMGPSGSGKTTLLGLLGGLVAPTKGEVVLGGEPIAHMRDHHRTRWRRDKVGYVLQDLGLVPKMSLRENVLLPLVPTGGALPADRERAEALLARFGIADRADTPVERLSGGERQRGALARALMRSPPLLLLDEPTAHVDAESASAIVALLGELRGEGTAIVASTHDPRLAEATGVDRRLVMREGRLAPASEGSGGRP